MNDINRISILGGSGSGKTTLSKRLSQTLNIPSFHLDSIQFKENWIERDPKERDEIIRNIILKDKWIIDGNYTSTLIERLNNSDLVIFLDYSTFILLKGILKRHKEYKNKEREDIKGCKEHLDIKFIFLTLFWRKRNRKTILNIIKESNNKNVLIFKNRKELNQYLIDNNIL